MRLPSFATLRPRTRPPPDRLRERRLSYTSDVRYLLLALLLLFAPLTASCADRPLIRFENFRDDRVAVHIDGDRVLILRPHTAEGLPYQVAAWTWPREIEVRDEQNQRIFAFKASAGDLALRQWRVDIR